MELGRVATAVTAAGMSSVLLLACSSGVAVDKAGGGPPPLRLGVEHGPGMPASIQMEYFAEQVAQLSDGQLQVELVWRAAAGQDDEDQAVASLVIDGRLDLGMVPARAWDSLGVTTFQALHAPFLVTSDVLLERIVADDELVGDMLAGLDEVGVTGLELVPESLRHVFFYGDPVTTPAQFDGLRVRVARSETVYALFEALGAAPDDFSDWGRARLEQAARNGGIDAAESSFVWASQVPGGQPLSAVGDLPLLAKVNSLVINTRAFGRLTEQQRGTLAAAARATTTWAIETNPTTEESAAEYCAGGGSIVHADDADVAAFQQATAPVYDRLAGDPLTRALLDRIRILSDELGATPTVVAPCAPDPAMDLTQAGGSSSEDSAADPDGFPEGVYRAEVARAFLEDAGIDTATAHNHAGTWTLSFDDGRLIVEDVTDAGVLSVDEGVYCVEDGRVNLGVHRTPPTCGDFWSAGWRLEGDQLHFLDLQPGSSAQAPGEDALLRAIFGSQPWSKIC